MRNPRSALALVAVGAFSLALAGCGSSSSADSSSTSSASNSASASASTSASASASTSAASGDTVKAAELVGQVQQAMAKAGSFTVVQDAAGTKSTSNVEIKNGVGNTSATVDASGTAMQIISLNNGKQVFLKGAMTKNAWVPVTKTSTNPMVKQMATMLASLQGQLNPTASLSLYQAAGTFTKAGTETVNGVSATHYTGKLPVAAVVQAAPAELRSMMTQAMGKDPVPLDLYVDSQNRLVDAKITVSASGSTSVNDQKFSNYGKVFNIKAPA